MKIGLHDHEHNGYPNVALMKISAWHKKHGDTVGWFNSFAMYDKVYSSKVFTWTKTDPYLPSNTIMGGTGFDVETVLSDNVEFMCPDYSVYDCEESYGFVTRGCIRSCQWCFVPRKEGFIRRHQDVEEFARHQKVVLMDNNILACEHGIEQLEKISRLKLTIDCNQGLDARLIDSSIAKLLARNKWKPSIRLACDSAKMIEPVRKAVELLRWHNATPSRYFCYVLVKDVDDALERVKFLKGIY
ncbi:MAG: radical SAM protein, partial [Gammaproteobacteria bacterium]|nr:radical SAM protein [Gammaproteobacteria bacterium]